MTSTPSRPVRVASAAVGVAGVVLLAGCSVSTTASTAEDTTSTSDSSVASSATATGSTDSSTESSSSSSSQWVDGTYTADGSYRTPESVETITVTLTIADGVVSDVDVTGDPQARESQQYQSQFASGIAAEVVGKSLDEISVDRVAGSSLTSEGFNEALATIETEAAA